MITGQKEAYPLFWPADWPRTRPQDQKSMSAWKRTANQYRKTIIDELARMGSPQAVISSNVPLTVRNEMQPGIEPLDVGVAVYFRLKPKKDDFGWQDALGLKDPYPTLEQIQTAYKRLAAQYHPDVAGGDVSMFQAVTRHRDAAVKWVTRKNIQEFDYVIAADHFAAVRLNMCAIGLTLKAIRQIERCGTSSLLERAFKGFQSLPAQGETSPAQETVGATSGR